MTEAEPMVRSDRAALSPPLDADLQLVRRILWRGESPLDGWPQEINGPSLLHTLECHRLTGVFYDRIARRSDFPEFIRGQLSEITGSGRFRSLEQTGELCRVLDILQKGGVRAVVLKGPPLSQRYYGNPALRECNDLDILVAPESIETSLNLLLAQGYTFSDTYWNTPKQKEVYLKNFHHYNLYHPEKDIILELHWRLYSSASISAEMDRSIWQSLGSCRLGSIHAPVLSAQNNLIYLCVHGGSHRWRRLFWLRDIAVILQQEGDDFAELAFKQALGWGAGRYVLLGCYLAHLLFGSELSAAMRRTIEADGKIEPLAQMALSAINRTSAPTGHPLANRQSIVRSFREQKNQYYSVYLFGGWRALVGSFRRFFINPAYWRLYAFSDRFFFLNYAAAPFFWMYSLSKKSGDGVSDE